MKSGLTFAVIAGLLLTGCLKHDQEARKNLGAPRSIIGVGLELRVTKDQTIIIQSVVPNSPAAKAGLTQGLVIETIDGTPADGTKLKQCVDMIRGPEGSTVMLELVDPKQGTTNSVTLTRETIALPKVRNAPPTVPAPGP